MSSYLSFIPIPTLSSLLSLLIPTAYLTILVGSLATFSTLYRQRLLNSKLRLSPYFPPHTSRNVYLTLLHQADTQSDLKNVPNSILMAALQERAIEDIMRIREIQTRKAPLNTLLQRGVVGDDIWQRLLRAEQELEAELKDVVAEANALANGWGGHIFQSANEIVVNRMTKKVVEDRRANLASEKEAWEKTREQSRLELEGEMPTQQSQSEKSSSAVTPAASTPAASTTTSTPEKPRTVPQPAAVSSDEDAVLVETPASEARPETPVETGTTGGSGKNKKKKGKKGLSTSN